MNNMKEKWKILNKFPLYKVSNKGNISYVKNNSIPIEILKDKNNFIKVKLWNGNKFILTKLDRLIYFSFSNKIIKGNSFFIQHINKINDDNNYSNLKLIWVRGHENNNIYKQIPKLGIKMFDKENNLIDVFFDAKEANIKTKISTQNIRCCCYRNYCNNNKTNFSIKGYIFKYIIV